MIGKGRWVQEPPEFHIVWSATTCAFSALTLLVGWQEGHLACKNFEWWGTGMVICLERDADLHMAQLMPLPLPLTVSCFSKIQIGFTFLVLAHPGSPGKRAVRRVCLCVWSATTSFTTHLFCLHLLKRKLMWFWFDTLVSDQILALLHVVHIN